MKASSLRQWSTPAVIAAGLFVAVSGVLMFFGVHEPIQHAHEWIGLVFAAAIALHIVNHWRAVKGYVAQPVALGIAGAVALATAFLVVGGEHEEGGHGHGIGGLIHSIEGAPLTTVAPLLHQSPEQILGRVQAAGFEVQGTDQSIVQIASANRAEPKAVMRLLLD